MVEGRIHPTPFAVSLNQPLLLGSSSNNNSNSSRLPLNRNIKVNRIGQSRKDTTIGHRRIKLLPHSTSYKRRSQVSNEMGGKILF
jgi:hypothetical protein